MRRTSDPGVGRWGAIDCLYLRQGVFLKAWDFATMDFKNRGGGMKVLNFRWKSRNAVIL